MLRLLDTHQHLIYPEVASYSWTNGSQYLEGKSFTLQDFQAAAKALNIQSSLFMEVGVDDQSVLAATEFISKLASDSTNNIKGLIATCRPETEEGFDAWLDRAPELGIVGYRRVLQNQPDDLLRSAVLQENIRKIGSKGLVFDVCVRAHQLPAVQDLATACQNTKLVLNHCGNPDIANGEIENWSACISGLAQLPNMFCKLSGVVPKTKEGELDFGSLEPYFAHMLETFGPNRIVWGSDWPVVNRAGGLGLWGKVTHDILSRLSDTEAAAIAHKNAEEIYGVLPS